MKSQKEWNKEEVNFLINNYNKYESYILAEKLKRSKESVYNKLWRLRKIGILKFKKNKKFRNSLKYTNYLGILGEHFSKKYFERNGFKICTIPIEVIKKSNTLKLKRGYWKNDPHGTDFDFAMEKDNKIYLVEVKANTSKLQYLQNELIEIFKNQYTVLGCQIIMDIQKIKNIIKNINQKVISSALLIKMTNKYERELVKDIKIKKY